MRKLYDALLEDGELQNVIEDATGVWSEDKRKFKEYYDMVRNMTITDFENID